MHNNALINTVGNIKAWLHEHRIDIINWLPYSLDLNPIENLWALLKVEVYKQHLNLINAPNTIYILH